MGRGEAEDTFSDATVDLSDQAEDLCVAFSTGGVVEEVALPRMSELTIGRSSKCDVRLDDPSVSRRHAILRRSSLHIQIMDLGSSNGVNIGGGRIAPDQWVALQPGQSVTIGSGFLIVRPASSTSRPRRIWPHGYFEGRVEEECERNRRSGVEFAVMRLSVPDFLEPADVEHALAEWVRSADVLARYAPNEYEVLFVDLTPEKVDLAVHRLMTGLAAALAVESAALVCGVAHFPRDERSADELISLANDALRGSRPRVRESTAQSTVLQAQIESVADSNMSVLILGETGVGKEICAEQLHGASSRRDRKLLRLNCAALTETLLEGELFGYEKGAFTGATHAKPGLFETADGGTVFLDEIGEMPMSTQVKLLRVIEERKVQRIGALEPKAIDVRFLTATNRDLEAEVAAGRFRQDLLFRINTFTLHIPPLRERKGEIEPLARHFAAQASTDAGVPEPQISTDFLMRLERYPWPGNIRELRNVMERAVVLSRGGQLTVEHLPLDKMNATVSRTRAATPPPLPNLSDAAIAAEFAERPTLSDIPAGNLRSQVEEFERKRIMDALEECAGNQTRAAKLLGISRGRLIKRLDRYGIPRPRKR